MLFIQIVFSLFSFRKADYIDNFSEYKDNMSMVQDKITTTIYPFLYSFGLMPLRREKNLLNEDKERPVEPFHRSFIYYPCQYLSYKMHRIPRLVTSAWSRLSSCGLEYPGHIVGQSPHCLQAFFVQSGLSRLTAINNVPVL